MKYPEAVRSGKLLDRFLAFESYWDCVNAGFIQDDGSSARFFVKLCHSCNKKIPLPGYRFHEGKDGKVRPLPTCEACYERRRKEAKKDSK